MRKGEARRGEGERSVVLIFCGIQADTCSLCDPSTRTLNIAPIVLCYNGEETAMEKKLLIFVVILALLLTGGALAWFGRNMKNQIPGSSPNIYSPLSAEKPKEDSSSGEIPRLTLRGSEILDPQGKPVTLRGFSWGRWGMARPGDGKENVAQGATMVRIPLRWWGIYGDESIDSRADAAPGHIDPAHLAELDRMIQDASSAGLWIDLFIDSDCGQNGTQEDKGTAKYCDPEGKYGSNGRNFWSDRAERAKFFEVWKFVADRYKDTPYIGMYELLPEPNPAGYSAEEVSQFYQELIAAIRPIDSRTPFLVGAYKGYNIKSVESAYIKTSVPIIYTGNLFVYTERGNSASVIGNLEERLKYLTDFRDKYQVPVFVQQTGARSGDDPEAVYADAVLSLLNKNRVGWAWWTYRQENFGDGFSIEYQKKDGSWVRKDSLLATISKHFKY